MLKKFAILVVALILAGSFGACKKKEEKPQLPPGHPGMANGMPGMPKVERTVVVPKDVKAKWKAVKIAITDKATKGSKEYTLTVGSDLAVPKTNVTIKVLAFLPDFRMSEGNHFSLG